MIVSSSDLAFSGSIPQLYDQYLVPLLFEPYAKDMARRVAALQPSSVLEVAAGTGVLTRLLAARLPLETALVATDLNRPMLDHAASLGAARSLVWQQADAGDLPFPEGIFDVVVCQFGAMFFADKPRAFSEARRVLRPGGTFLCSVWDNLEHNPIALCVTRALADLFPGEPPCFLARIPHGYADGAVLASDLRKGGFMTPLALERVAAWAHVHSPWIPAAAYCHGTPLRAELESRAGVSLGEVTDHVARAIEQEFGEGPFDTPIQALVVSAIR